MSHIRSVIALAITLAAVVMVVAPSAAAPTRTPGWGKNPYPSTTHNTADLRLSNGIYSWWSSPQTVSVGDSTYTASIARLGTVRLARVDADGSSVVVNLEKITPDDHNTPAIAYSPESGRMTVFYARHANDDIMRYREVLDLDTLALGPLRHLSYSDPVTYAQTLVLGERIVLVSRTGSDWTTRVSEDWGDTWGPERLLVDYATNGRPYVLTAQSEEDPTKAMIAVYGHPVTGTYRNIDVGVLDVATGDVGRLDGTVVTNAFNGPDLRFGQLEAAVDPGTGYRVRLLDVGWHTGRPAVAYAVWNHAEDPGGEAVYRYATYDGNAWTPSEHRIAAGKVVGYSPATQYVGGMTFGHDGMIYVARNGRYNSWWRLEELSTSGTTVTQTRILYRSTTPIMRPHVPRFGGPVDVIAIETLVYRGFTSYDSNLLLF